MICKHVYALNIVWMFSNFFRCTSKIYISLACQGSSPPFDPTNSSSFVRDVILRTCLGIESSKKSVIKSWSGRDDSQSMSIEDIVSLYLLSPTHCNILWVYSGQDLYSRNQDLYYYKFVRTCWDLGLSRSLKQKTFCSFRPEGVHMIHLYTSRKITEVSQEIWFKLNKFWDPNTFHSWIREKHPSPRPSRPKTIQNICTTATIPLPKAPEDLTQTWDQLRKVWP